MPQTALQSQCQTKNSLKQLIIQWLEGHFQGRRFRSFLIIFGIM